MLIVLSTIDSIMRCTCGAQSKVLDGRVFRGQAVIAPEWQLHACRYWR